MCVCACAETEVFVCVCVCRDRVACVSAETEWATDTQPITCFCIHFVSNNLHYSRTHVCAWTHTYTHTHTHTHTHTCKFAGCGGRVGPHAAASQGRGNAQVKHIFGPCGTDSPVSLNSSHRCINVSSLTFTAAQDEFLLQHVTART